MANEHDKRVEKSQPASPPAGTPAGTEGICQAVAGAAAGVGGIAGEAASLASQAAANAGKTVEGAIAAGLAAVEKAAGAGQAIGKVAAQAGSVAAVTAGEVLESAAHQSQRLFEHGTHEAGRALTVLGENPVLRYVSKIFRADWLLAAIGQVDVGKAQAAVRKLQQEYPQESPSQIAHRIMVDKALSAGGIGLVSGFVPGMALALLAIDLAATTQLQAEMVYEIAAAYGMDLTDPKRKGEVLAIFGLALGGSRAVKAGLGLLRTVPFAGAAIGASANAVMLYTLGYAACRFYESKVSPLTSEAAAEEVKKGSEDYLKLALAQQAVMDRVLAEMILASHPEKSWDDILPELKSLNLTPASLDAIAAHIKSPQPLQELLGELNSDFARPLLLQCYRIALSDGVIAPAEQRVIEAIANKFGIPVGPVEEAVKSEMRSR